MHLVLSCASCVFLLVHLPLSEIWLSLFFFFSCSFSFFSLSFSLSFCLNFFVRLSPPEFWLSIFDFSFSVSLSLSLSFSKLVLFVCLVLSEIYPSLSFYLSLSVSLSLSLCLFLSLNLFLFHSLKWWSLWWELNILRQAINHQTN